MSKQTVRQGVSGALFRLYFRKSARQSHHIVNKALYLALAINSEGQKEILGFWILKKYRGRSMKK